MKIHLPHGAFLGNIDQFLAGFDPANSEKLDITAVDRWMWLHPMVLSMVASLALKIDSKKISCQKITARSGHRALRHLFVSDRDSFPAAAAPGLNLLQRLVA